MSRIVELAGRRWLAGMSWRSYDKPPARPMIRTEARALKAVLYVQRSGSIRAPMGVLPRYDVGFAGADAKKGRAALYSLGAALSGAKPGPWRGEFDLGEGIGYYIAVDPDGAIVPDQYGETIGDKEAILAARQAHEGLFESATEVHGDIQLLEKLLSELAGPFTRVQPLTKQFNPLVLLPAFAILAAAAGGYELYAWHNAKLEYQRQAALQAALLRQRLAPPPLSPLEKQPPPTQWLAQCNPEHWHLNAVVNAWEIKQYECTQTSVILTWGRAPGATATPRPSGTIDDTGMHITQVIPLTYATSAKMSPHTNVAYEAIADSRANLQAWAERAGLTAQFGVISAVPGFPFKQCAVTITSPLRPWSLASTQLNRSLRLQSLNSTGTGDWVIKGILYGS